MLRILLLGRFRVERDSAPILDAAWSRGEFLATDPTPLRSGGK